MNNLLSLMKITLINNLRLNKVFKKKNILKIILAVLVTIIGVSAILFFVGFQFYFVGLETIDNHGGGVLLSYGFIIISLFLVILVLSQANSYLFKSKDFDFLVSLPIKTNAIIISKITSLLIVTYASMFIIYVPLIVVYALLIETTIMFYIVALIVFILFPLIIVSILSFVSYVFGLLLSKFKYKNFVAIVFPIIFIVVYFLFTTNQTTNPDDPTGMNLFIGISERLKAIYYPAYLSKEALLGNYQSLVLYVVITGLIFSGFVLITSKLYLKINTSLKRLPKKSKFDENIIKVNNSSSLKTLFILEVKKYVSIPTYVVNTLVGKLLMPIMIFSILSQMSGVEIEGNTSELFVYITLGMAVLFITMLATTTSSISLEGKKLWLLKSSPIKTTDIFISKILIDVILSLFFSLISLIIIIIYLKPTVLLIIFFSVVVILVSLINGIAGLLINLKFPRLDWDIPVRVVKQSKSVLIHMLLAFLFDIVSVGLTIFLLSKVIPIATYGLVILYLSVVLFLLILLLNKKGTKWFNKLKA